MRIQKWGNSLALRIPRSFAKEARIDQGAMVDISVKDGKIIIAPPARRTYTLDTLLAGVSKTIFTRNGKLVSRPVRKHGETAGIYP